MRHQQWDLSSYGDPAAGGGSLGFRELLHVVEQGWFGRRREIRRYREPVYATPALIDPMQLQEAFRWLVHEVWRGNRGLDQERLVREINALVAELRRALPPQPVNDRLRATVQFVRPHDGDDLYRGMAKRVVARSMPALTDGSL